MNNLIINSYNCRSVKNSLADVRCLCDRSSIVLLQEHWIPQQELEFFNNVHKDFISFSSSPVDLSKELLVGRPYGGLAILVRKDLAENVKVVDISDSRFMCIRIDMNNEKF